MPLDTLLRLLMLVFSGSCQLVALLICLGIGSLAASTTVSDEERIKVSYLYNFAKFIKWPSPLRENDQFQHFLICTAGEKPLSGHIGQLQNKEINGRPIEVWESKLAFNNKKPCEILFISGSEQSRYPLILQEMAYSSTLTVSDIPGFTEQGGMIGMMVIENRVRFIINLKAIQDAGLSADSQLLNLAVEVTR